MYRVFVVEDDPVIAGAICAQMDSWGLEARCAKDFGAVMAEFAAFDPQLVLLDISLPRYSGYHWCAEIRKVSKVPVMFISSASDNMNIVMAMNMGGRFHRQALRFGGAHGESAGAAKAGL